VQCERIHAVVAVRFQRLDGEDLSGGTFVPMHDRCLPSQPEAAFSVCQQGLSAGREPEPFGFSETLQLSRADVAQGRVQIETCIQDPQRTVRVFADVPCPALPLQREMSSDYASLDMK
jgi:hypothetical protein